MKKYELIPEGKLFRIIALKDFGFIKKGELGGLIEKESNLSQKNECWVYKYAKVYGNALVSGDAQVLGDAEVRGNAKVYGNAEVSGDALVSGNAKVSGDAEVYGNALVSDDAKVYGNAKVYDNARVIDESKVTGNAKVYGNAYVLGNTQATKEVITFGNIFDYDITITDNHIKIGCQQYLKSRWLEFTNKEILEMGGKRALKFWGLFKPFAINMGFFN